MEQNLLKVFKLADKLNTKQSKVYAEKKLKDLKNGCDTNE